MTKIDQFDHYLQSNGPAALVIREYLMPVEGVDGVLFPSTYASGEGFKGGYNIDSNATGNVVLVDSVGSQGNRIEPIFKEENYSTLVPQVVVTAGEKEINILDAGHRAGDALFRCSPLQDELHAAFKSVQKGDATALAKIAPTSLVFGVWDSRDTQAKMPRLIASTIRAFNVRELTRGAVYVPPINYSEEDVFSEEEKAKAEGDKKSPLSKRGFVHNPASGSHGGVIADGGVRRDATLGLAALRLLHAGGDAAKTLTLRRYILGLAMVAFTYNPSGYLRQGCLLVLNPVRVKENEFVEVLSSGERNPVTWTHKQALEFAKKAADEFVVGIDRKVAFDKELAKKDVKAKDEAKKKAKKGAKAETEAQPNA